MKNDELKVYTLQEVADTLKLTRQTIYNYIGKKQLRATKYGKEYRVSEQDLRDFIKNGHN